MSDRRLARIPDILATFRDAELLQRLNLHVSKLLAEERESMRVNRVIGVDRHGRQLELNIRGMARRADRDGVDVEVDLP